MILPNPDWLNRFNKYALVVLAAKRAKHLQEQGIARRSLVKSSSNNPLTIALEEVAAGRLVPSFNPEPFSELVEAETPEVVLTAEDFEEAMAKVANAVEADLPGSDNGHEIPDASQAFTEAEADEEVEEEGTALAEEDLSVSDHVSEILGLEEEETEAERQHSE
jgi:DNA-directed RNA polymerase subunit omega